MQKFLRNKLNIVVPADFYEKYLNIKRLGFTFVLQDDTLVRTPTEPNIATEEVRYFCLSCTFATVVSLVPKEARLKGLRPKAFC